MKHDGVGQRFSDIFLLSEDEISLSAYIARVHSLQYYLRAFVCRAVGILGTQKIE